MTATLKTHVFGCILLLGASALPAAQRTFVSAGAGSDLNACTRSAPCRSFGAALAVTDPGGEVLALDSGGYGSFAVAQSARIEAPAGIAAAITVFSGSGLVFSGGVDDVLIVRGLRLNGLGGINGVHFASGESVHLDRVSVAGFSGTGTIASDGGFLSVDRSSFVGNAKGVQVGNGSVATTMVVRRTRFYGHGNIAASAYEHGDLTLADCTFTGNGTAVAAQSVTPATTARVFAVRSVFTQNVAVFAVLPGTGGATIWASGNTIADNAQVAVGPSILTRSDNTSVGNDITGGFTGTFSVK